MKKKGLVFCMVLLLSLWFVSSVEASNLTIIPKPTGNWSAETLELYVQFDGDPQSVNWASNRYGFSDTANTPIYNQSFTEPGKIKLERIGETYVHVRYQLNDDSYVYTTAGPYKIFTNSLNNFQAHITTSGNVEPQDWAKQALNLRIAYSGNEVVEGIEKQYKVKGHDSEWKVMQNASVPLTEEGEQEVLYRIINKVGRISETKTKTYKLDMTPPVFHHVAFEQTENGRYNILLWVVDEHSGIASVRVRTTNGFETLPNEAMSSIYKTSSIIGEPLAITATDIAGNVTEETFLEKPVITFNNYDPNAHAHHTEISAAVNGNFDKSYVFNGQKTQCGNGDCSLTIHENGLLTAQQVDGIKRSSTAVRIDNIDKRDLQLLLLGERFAGNDMTFKWNYQLNTGTLTCFEGDQERTFNVTGKSHRILGANNLKYSCTLKATYEGQQLTSNTVYLQSYPNEPVPLVGNFVEEPMLQMVYVEESRVGLSYLINTRQSNVMDNAARVPTGVIQ